MCDSKKRELFLSFDKKADIYSYYGISDNSSGVKFVNNVLDELGIPRDYYHNKRFPKRYCLCCGKKLKKGQHKFCSKQCFAKISNKKRGPYDIFHRERISNGLKEHYEKRDGINIHGRLNRSRYKNRICKFCGSVKIDGKCVTNDICKYGVQNVNKNLKYFGFNVETIGTKEAINEYYKIKALLEKEYTENLLSVCEIKEKYNYPGSTERLVHILKKFGIKLRNWSSSTRNAYLRSRLSLPQSFEFKSGWHEKPNGEKVYYRSSYELDYCKYLDKNGIDYKMENLRIQYFDTASGEYKVAIPDFYIESKNQITEVKSKFTFIKQNMLDKIKAYKENGYKTIVRIDGIDYQESDISNIEESLFTINYLRK